MKAVRLWDDAFPGPVTRVPQDQSENLEIDKTHRLALILYGGANYSGTVFKVNKDGSPPRP